MATLERAIAIAAEAHAGQVDKAGQPYILHPLRVMLAVAEPAAKIVAVLHDVVEDCPGWDFERLRAEGFAEDVLAALAAVTCGVAESYPAFIARAAADPLARAVKIADLRDNLDLRRIANPTSRDFDRLGRYAAALNHLLFGKDFA